MCVIFKHYTVTEKFILPLKSQSDTGEGKIIFSQQLKHTFKDHVIVRVYKQAQFQFLFVCSFFSVFGNNRNIKNCLEGKTAGRKPGRLLGCFWHS